MYNFTNEPLFITSTLVNGNFTAAGAGKIQFSGAKRMGGGGNVREQRGKRTLVYSAGEAVGESAKSDRRGTGK